MVSPSVLVGKCERQPHFFASADALFELADPSLPKGSLGQILKIGYALNGRVVRPAQVGTVK